MLAFEKVSLSQYQTDWQKKIGGEAEVAISSYDNISLPKRSTRASAGYDFFAPYDFSLAPGESMTILTGIRAIMPDHLVLIIAPRSGQSMKFKLQLMNTIGVIDADYAEAKNEGHIMIALYNDHPGDAVLEVKAGDAFAQGIFLPYYTTDDDNTQAQREGGFGSTDKKA
ncbi:MAG: deoxyuridine 5'-triphosphate nucleotidohydrolase [Peptococcaceae bacterium]|nr:deoxyuridine 5'-triphosphate nucleotidohydrolase [Peptococcaceae bacterium]